MHLRKRIVGKTSVCALVSRALAVGSVIDVCVNKSASSNASLFVLGQDNEGISGTEMFSTLALASPPKRRKISGKVTPGVRDFIAMSSEPLTVVNTCVDQ